MKLSWLAAREAAPVDNAIGVTEDVTVELDEPECKRIFVLCMCSSRSKCCCSCSSSSAFDEDAITFDESKFGFGLFACNEDDDEVRLYVADVLPNLTTVLSLLDLCVIRIGDLNEDGTIHVTNIAHKARIAPNRNGGPGNKCLKLKWKYFN